MKNKLTCIMLVDDNHNDNFFHERVIRKTNSGIIVIEENSGLKALEYLKSIKRDKGMVPDLILLDINMPGMNGWEFLQEYERLDKQLQSKVIIIMLTSTDNVDDAARGKAWSFVSDFITKPMTEEIMNDIIKKYFD